jgi:hypothetical protein
MGCFPCSSPLCGRGEVAVPTDRAGDVQARCGLNRVTWLGQFDEGQIDLDQAECVRNAYSCLQWSGSNRARQAGSDGVVESRQAREAATSGLRDWFRAAYCARASQRLLRASVAWPFTHFH